MIRTLFTIVLLVVVAYAATTFPIGKRTLWGHIQAIWKTSEAKDLRDGISDTAKPVLKKVKEGVESELEKPRPGATMDAAPSPP